MEPFSNQANSAAGRPGNSAQTGTGGSARGGLSTLPPYPPSRRLRHAEVPQARMNQQLHDAVDTQPPIRAPRVDTRRPRRARAIPHRPRINSEAENHAARARNSMETNFNEARTEVFLNSLPIVASNNLSNEKDENCPICMEPYGCLYGNSEWPVRLPCNHIFGKLCLTKWMKSSARNAKNNACPICRTVLIERVPNLSDYSPPSSPESDAPNHRNHDGSRVNEVDPARLAIDMALANAERARREFENFSREFIAPSDAPDYELTELDLQEFVAMNQGHSEEVRTRVEARVERLRRQIRAQDERNRQYRELNNAPRGYFTARPLQSGFEQSMNLSPIAADRERPMPYETLALPPPPSFGSRAANPRPRGAPVLNPAWVEPELARLSAQHHERQLQETARRMSAAEQAARAHSVGQFNINNQPPRNGPEGLWDSYGRPIEPPSFATTPTPRSASSSSLANHISTEQQERGAHFFPSPDWMMRAHPPPHPQPRPRPHPRAQSQHNHIHISHTSRVQSYQQNSLTTITTRMNDGGSSLVARQSESEGGMRGFDGTSRGPAGSSSGSG